MATLYTILGWLVLIPAAFAVDVSVNEINSCPVDQYINGCSVPGGLPFFYKETFTPACRMHDVCYRCNEVYGWQKSACDDAFKENMYKLCEKKYLVIGKSLGKQRNKLCRKAAGGYHFAVAKFGNSNWSKYTGKKFEWCKMPCALKIGNPANKVSK